MIIKYCPWCDYQADTFNAVHKHMADKHAFLAGAAPPIDTRYAIVPPEEFEPNG